MSGPEDVSHSDRTFASRLRQVAAAIEDGTIRLPAPHAGGGTPTTPEEARKVRIPERFGRTDYRAPEGARDLQVGGRTLGDLVDDPGGRVWLEDFFGHVRSPRLRTAIRLVLRGHP